MDSAAPPTSMAQKVDAGSGETVETNARWSPVVKAVLAVARFLTDRGALAARIRVGSDEVSLCTHPSKLVERRRTGEADVGRLAAGEERSGKREHALRGQSHVKRLRNGRAGVEDIQHRAVAGLDAAGDECKVSTSSLSQAQPKATYGLICAAAMRMDLFEMREDPPA